MKDDKKLHNLARALKFNELRTRKLLLSEWKVLLTLAESGPLTMYSITKIQNARYPNIHKATKSLEKMNWVKIIKKEKSKKKVIVKIYSLTREGLLWVLARIPTLSPEELAFDDSAKPSPRSLKSAILKNKKDVEARLFQFDIGKTVEGNTELFPVVFENWGFCKDIKVADRLSAGLPQAAISALCDYYYLGSSSKEFSSLDELFTYYLYYGFFESEAGGHAVFQGDQEKDRSFAEDRNRALKMRDEGKDPRLREIVQTVMKDLEEDLSTRLKFVKSLAINKYDENS